MSDLSGGFGSSKAADRLSGLRAATAAPPATSRSPFRRNVRPELWVGVLLILGGIAVVLYLRGGADVAPTAQTPTADSVSQVSTAPIPMGLLAGEVMVAFPAEAGHFPPALNTGDEVRLIVTPGMDGAGEVRPLVEPAVVVAVDNPTATVGDTVITVRGPESIATAIAGSGPVRVAIVRINPS